MEISYSNLCAYDPTKRKGTGVVQHLCPCLFFLSDWITAVLILILCLHPLCSVPSCSVYCLTVVNSIDMRSLIKEPCSLKDKCGVVIVAAAAG